MRERDASPKEDEGGGHSTGRRGILRLGEKVHTFRSTFFSPPFFILFLPPPRTVHPRSLNPGRNRLSVCRQRGRLCPDFAPMLPFPAVYTPRAPQGHRELVSIDKLRMLKLVTVLCVAHAAALMPAARPLKLSSKHARAMPLQMSDVKGPKDWAFIKGKVRRTSTPCLDRPAAGVVVAVRLRLRLSCLCRRPRAAPPPFGIAPSLSPRGCASS